MDKNFIRLLISVFMVLITMMILIQAVSIRTLNSISTITTNLYEHPFAVSNAVLDLNLHIVQMHRDMKDVALADNDEELELAIALVDTQETEVIDLFNYIETRFLGESSRIEVARQYFINWRPIREQVIRLIREKRNSEAVLITQNEGAIYISSLLTTMDGLVEFANNRASEFVTSSNNELSQSRNILYGLMTLALLAGVIISFLVIKRVIQNTESLKRADRVLEQSENRFRAIYDNAPVLIDAFDEQGRCVLWNKECHKTFGWTIEEINAHENPLELFYPDPAVRAEVLLTVTKEPNGQFREWSARTKDGRTLTTLWANFRLPDGMAFSMGHDITDRKKAEGIIAKSLEEKETLLKEIHHRVKNNLQVVSSLLSLQKSRQTDPHASQILEESERRIKVMAQLHETLHQSKDLSSINIRNYLNSVALGVLQILEGQVPNLTFTCDVEEINFDISQSMALGQILSELMSNCAKHAFIDRENGHIKVELHRIKDKEIELSVIDDGNGFPDNFNIKESSALGLKLTQGLVQQLHGKLSIDSSEGTGIRITFEEKVL